MTTKRHFNETHISISFLLLFSKSNVYMMLITEKQVFQKAEK